MLSLSLLLLLKTLDIIVEPTCTAPIVPNPAANFFPGLPGRFTLYAKAAPPEDEAAAAILLRPSLGIEKLKLGVLIFGFIFLTGLEVFAFEISEGISDEEEHKIFLD